MFNELITKYFSKGNSKDVAKKRLQFAIVYDKLDVSEDVLHALQQDMVSVISRYFVIDKKSVKIDIGRDDNMSALIVNIPIVTAVRQSPKPPPAVSLRHHKGK